jgi:hypothetical protein
LLQHCDHFETRFRFGILADAAAVSQPRWYQIQTKSDGDSTMELFGTIFWIIFILIMAAAIILPQLLRRREEDE